MIGTLTLNGCYIWYSKEQPGLIVVRRCYLCQITMALVYYLTQIQTDRDAKMLDYGTIT